MEEIVASHQSRVANRGDAVAIDDRTCNDLLLDEVFQAIDRTESTLGRHALYHRLRTAHGDESLRVFEALVTRMSDDPSCRERTQLALGRLRDPHGYNLWWLGRPDAIDAPAWYALFPILTVLTLALALLLIGYPGLLPLVVGLLVLNFAVHLATFRRIDAAAAAFRQIAPLVATGQALRFLGGDDIEPIAASFRHDTALLRRLKTISRWVSGDPLMLSVHPHPAAAMIADPISVFYDYVNFVLPVHASGVYLGAATVQAGASSLLDLMAAIGDVDATVSVASLRANQFQWTRPRFTPQGSSAVITEAIHPLLTNGVPNSITLAPGAGVLVTGSNMSGKSTFLRTVGITTVLAQSLHTCFANGYEAPLLHVRSCIGRADDLVGGKSYYMVEVEALLELVQASHGNTSQLFLLDELFRGTNAVERIAGAEAVLTELNGGGSRPHVVIAATHDGELVGLLAGSYAPYHFGDTLTDEELSFDYHLQPGRATSRNAIALLRLNGAPPALVDRALASAAKLDRQRG